MMDSSVEIGMGKVSIPSLWEVRTQVSLIEPPGKALKVPLSIKGPAEEPRANVVISRRPAEHQDLKEALDSILKEMAQFARGLSRGESGELIFSDGGKGFWVEIGFEAKPGLRVIQQHTVRIEGDTLIHLVATVDEPHKGKIEILREIITSYSPV